MSKKITDDNPIVVLIIATSFGEIDWILPVLKFFMDKNDDWRLMTVFGHKVVFDKFRHASPRLFKEFIEVSSHNIVPQEIEPLFSDAIDPGRVKIILKDFNKDEFAPYKREIAERCPEALVVSYPHSSHIYSSREKDPMAICENPEDFSKHDIFLLSSENDIPQWSEYVDVKKIRALGYPRFDSWWLERLLQDPELKATEEFKRSKEADKVFFWASRGAHPQYLSQFDYEYLVRSVAEVVFSYENSLLLIRPHPRQDLDELFKLLAPYDNNRCLLSGLHLLQLSHLSDVVISGWSCGILDALATGKPVIEFWRFGGRDPICRRAKDGSYTTIYRELGLAAAADTKEELDALLQIALKDPGAPIWKSQDRAFKKSCKFTDQAANDIVRSLETELVRHTASEASPVTEMERNDRDEMINKMIEFVTSLVEMGQNEKARIWLEFMDEQFPKDVRVLNNFGIFLFNRGEVNGAVDRLVECLNLTPSCSETAVNLIQILLIVERTNDALEIVVSYYSQIADEGSQRIFLQALAAQLTEQQFAVVHRRIEQMGQ